MKKTIKLFICLITTLCIITGTANAFAQTDSPYMSADISYNKTDYSKNVLKITGKTDSSVSYVTLYVTDSSVKKEDIALLSDISKIKIADAIHLNEGIIDASYNLGEYLSYGKYSAYLFVGSDSFQNADFTYFSPDDKLERDRQNILTALKTASDWKVFKEIFFGTDSAGQTVNDNLSFISPDMDSYYNKIKTASDRSDVFMRMYSNRKSLNAFEDISESFLKESKYVYEHPSSSQAGGGGSNASSGSLSGGGGSLPSFSTDAPGQSLANSTGFTDMNGHWAQSYVNKLSEMNIVSGYPDGTFRPENNVTRAEFVKLVASAFSMPQTGELIFGDVTAGNWFAPYVAGAASLGVVNGANGMFFPDDYITRQDAALILYRAISLKHTLDDGNIFFTDEREIDVYASVAVRSLAKQNIIAGMPDGSFMPKAHTTRSQAAALILKTADFMSIH